MASLYTHRDANVRKTWFLMSVFLVVIILLGWLLSYVYDAQEILVIAVVFSLGMNILSYWKSDKIALAVSGAQPADGERFKELHRTVENLAITAGLPKPRLYVIRDMVPNAFATGRDEEHAAVAVTTGLLDILNKTELEGVLAHELSHVGNRDILVSTVVVVLVGFVTLVSDFFLRATLYGGNRRNNNGGGILAVVGLILIILSPIFATLIQLAISRKREFLADASGALLTRYPEALAAALEKIGKHSGRMQKANHATAHLFIANPFGPDGKRTGFLNKIFSTHPPVMERINALLGRESAL